jgi:hypothetical protein|tara:strand:- start:1197 stop:1484 length:288 start_codon:yes stop_codon:yes gene_type:complete
MTTSNKLKNTLLKSHRASQSNDSAFSEQVGGDWYKKLKIQPLDYAMDNNLNPCQAKVVKYVSRYNLKHKAIKEQIKDLQKAKHVIDILIEKIEGK